MSAEVTFALIGVTVVVLLLLTYASFRYIPMVLEEEEAEEPTEGERTEMRELPGENLAD
jgi:hypothetical protein